MKRAWVFAAFPIVAFAQVGAPSLGLVPDGSQIRRMYGLPAAGVVGDAIDLGRDLSAIAISPRQDYALATASDNGAALLILANGAVTEIAGASPNAARIAISPTGSAAALWFPSNSHFEMVTGLPAVPSIREIDATALGPPIAFAVSDDGRLAGSWPSGVHQFGTNGALSSLSVPGEVFALAFFAQRPDLALATAANIFSVTDGTISTLFDANVLRENARRPQLHATSAPVGIAASFDNQWLVTATRAGTLIAIDMNNGNASTMNCFCAPQGVFGIGGAVFRLTNPFAVITHPSGNPLDIYMMNFGVELFDAAAGAVLSVPPSQPQINAASHLENPLTTAAVAAVSKVTIGGLPTSSGYLQQPGITVSLAASYSTDLTGTLTLAFASSVGGDDQTIQFGPGGRTAQFTIPAGSTQASFSGQSSIPVLTGTVAGTITLTVSSLISSGTDVTPSPPPSATIVTNPTVPFISSVTFSVSTGALTVVVNGFSSSRDMTTGSFNFAPATGDAVAQSSIAVQLGSVFTTWYQSATSNAYGSAFTLTVPFSVQGDAADIVAVTVTLTNSKGTSNPVSPQ